MRAHDRRATSNVYTVDRSKRNLVHPESTTRDCVTRN
jgi:hypothetical protein